MKTGNTVATFSNINKEEYAAEALEILNVRRENYVVYGEWLLSKGEHPDRIREEIEDELESDMEKALFERLKRRGIVCGDWDLESIRIPEGVVSIGDFAFSGCRNLRRVKLPQTLKSIGREAFSYCEKLIRPDIPSGVDIGEDAFFLPVTW